MYFRLLLIRLQDMYIFVVFRYVLNTLFTAIHNAVCTSNWTICELSINFTFYYLSIALFMKKEKNCFQISAY